VLAELVARHGIPGDGGTDLGVHLSQAELGLLVGAKEAAVGKALRFFKESGLVTIRYRQVIITDVEKLRAFGEGH
jgi:CRP/FNR family cyclic AMP-dependent transcriptional regulator